MVSLCAVTDVPAYSLSQNMCVSYTNRSGIHVNKQLFRSGLYFIDLSIPLMVIPWYSLLMLASALQTLLKSSQNKNAWQLDFYCLILIYKRHSISLRHENITADPWAVRMSPDTSRPHQTHCFTSCLCAYSPHHPQLSLSHISWGQTLALFCIIMASVTFKPIT